MTPCPTVPFSTLTTLARSAGSASKFPFLTVIFPFYFSLRPTLPCGLSFPPGQCEGDFPPLPSHDALIVRQLFFRFFFGGAFFQLFPVSFPSSSLPFFFSPFVGRVLGFFSQFFSPTGFAVSATDSTYGRYPPHPHTAASLILFEKWSLHPRFRF